MTSLVAVDSQESPYTREQVDLIKTTVAKGATDEELKLFLYVAKKRRLDPLARQIYFQKHRNAKTGKTDITFITSIDAYRLTADRTGKYAGNDDPVFDDDESPRKAKVTVYKLIGGVRCPFSATARWDQYYPGDAKGFMWRKMPHLMLGKCAEALALRKAFPEELGGLYVKEEMDQASSSQQQDHQEEQPVDCEYEVEEEPQIDKYEATLPQKRQLATFAKAHGVTDKDDLAAMSKECVDKEVDMIHLDAAVREYVQDYLRKKNAQPNDAL